MTEKQVIFNAGYDAGHTNGSRRNEDPKAKQDCFDQFQEGTMGSGRHLLSFNDISMDFAEGRYLLAAIAAITGDYTNKFKSMPMSEVMEALRKDVDAMFEIKSPSLNKVDGQSFDAWLNATTIEVKKAFPEYTPDAKFFREKYFDHGVTPEQAAYTFIANSPCVD